MHSSLVSDSDCSDVSCSMTIPIGDAYRNRWHCHVTSGLGVTEWTRNKFSHSLSSNCPGDLNLKHHSGTVGKSIPVAVNCPSNSNESRINSLI